MTLRAVASNPAASGSGSLVGSGTYANMPAANTFTGRTYFATDVGPTGIVIYSDGVNRVPAWSQTLASSAVAFSVTGTTAETALVTVTIPAGLMGLNGALRISSTFSNTNNANNKTARIRFSGLAGTIYAGLTQTTVISAADLRYIRNVNSASSQRCSFTNTYGGFSTTGGAPVTSAVDTTAATALVFSGELANAGDTLTLNHYTVEVMP